MIHVFEWLLRTSEFMATYDLNIHGLCWESEWSKGFASHHVFCNAPPPPVVISRVAGEESENRAFSTSGPAKYPLSACQGSEMH